MPTRRHRWLARAEDAARALAYLYILLSGIGSLVFPLRSYSQLSSVLLTGWGVFQLAAVVALVGVLARKPIWEWRALVFLAVGVALYAVISWTSFLTEAPSHMGRAGDITAIVFLLIARFFAIWRKVLDAQEIENALRVHREDGPS